MPNQEEINEALAGNSRAIPLEPDNPAEAEATQQLATRLASIKGRVELDRMHGKAVKIITECAKTGEPIFVLRAKDLLSVMAVTEYANLVDKYTDDHDMHEGIFTALATMRDWQRENPGLVRLPD